MIYRRAAEFLDSGPGTLHNRVYKSNKEAEAKKIYALVSETLKYKTLLQHVIEASGILRAERRLTNAVALTMVHDLLLSKSKRLQCTKCNEKDAVMRHKTRLNAEFVKYKLKHGLTQDEVSKTPARWLRINPGKTTETDVEKEFRRLGLEATDTFNVSEKQWYKDEHVPGLYCVHPSIPISKLALYKNGSIIIQDRASCFPVAMMDPSPTKCYIDACAAPGNKTSQLASRARRVDAFERDKRRAVTLRKMIDMAGLASKVDIHVQDFTQTDPADYPSVAGLIVDPSCSGSGIFGRDSLEQGKEDCDPERLVKLAEFQYIIMSHALRFAADTVVYSTCSIHAQENEQVVHRLLSTPEIAKVWQLRRRDKVLPKWHRRGLAAEFADMKNPQELADACIRVTPIEDGGIGFFAACFERVSAPARD